MNKEMQRALEEDGEKLRALTGEDHGPWWIEYDEDGNPVGMSDDIPCPSSKSSSELQGQP